MAFLAFTLTRVDYLTFQRSFNIHRTFFVEREREREREREKTFNEKKLQKKKRNQFDSFVMSGKNCLALMLSLQKLLWRRPDTGCLDG